MFFRKKIEECGIRNGKMTENKKIKIGIISDTHGLLRTEVLDILQSCDCIFHAGDVDRPELLDTIRSLGALYVVRGNNDGYWAQNLRRSLNFTVGNVKFFMVHDRKDVAWELGDTQVVQYSLCFRVCLPIISVRGSSPGSFLSSASSLSSGTDLWGIRSRKHKRQ